VLGLQGGAELDAGLEVAAGFADGLEGAVQLGRAGAPAVAEEAVVLSAQPGHVGADGVGGELGGLAVEGFGFCGDGEVLVSDGAAGDFGVVQVPQAEGEALLSALLDLLARMQQAGLLSVSRCCTTCAHFSRDQATGRPVLRCGYFGSALRPSDLRVDCAAHAARQDPE
jgi:hypothetical protein